MVPDRFSPQKKWVIAFCGILILLGCILFAIGFYQQADEREHIIQLHLQKVATRLSGQVNGDGLLLLKPGDEGNPRYMTFARALYDARKNDTYITNAYILRVDNGTISYVVVDACVTRRPGPDLPRIGDLVTEDKDIILNATLSGPRYSDDIYTSKWGSYLSAYAPVRDSNGTVVGVLGVDEPAGTVLQYEYSSMLHLVEVG